MESPSATTTIGSAAWICPLRDLLGHAAILLDDVVALALTHDGLDRGDLVTGMHRELMRVGAELLVFGAGHRDALDTRGVSAFTDEIERLRLDLECLGKAFDALVHLSAHCFVQPDLCLTCAHDRSFSMTTYPSSRATTSPRGSSAFSCPVTVRNGSSTHAPLRTRSGPGARSWCSRCPGTHRGTGSVPSARRIPPPWHGSSRWQHGRSDCSSRFVPRFHSWLRPLCSPRWPLNVGRFEFLRQDLDQLG